MDLDCPPADHGRRFRRRSIHLRGYDYAKPGAYFATICTQNRECLFGEVKKGALQLNQFRDIVGCGWKGITSHFLSVGTDAFVVMPDHFHALVVIANAGRGEAFAHEKLRDWPDPGANASPLRQARGTTPSSLGVVSQNFKSVTTRKVNQARRTPGATVWHRNYYEHVIRDENSLNRAREYIAENPLGWELDQVENAPEW